MCSLSSLNAGCFRLEDTLECLVQKAEIVEVSQLLQLLASSLSVVQELPCEKELA